MHECLARVKEATEDLEVFAAASVLDEFVKHHASNTHQALKQLLAMRRNDLDKGFRDQVTLPW